MEGRRSAALARFWSDCRALAAQLGWALVFHFAIDAYSMGCGLGRHLRMPPDYWTDLSAGSGRRTRGYNWGADLRHVGVALGSVCSGLPSKSRPQVHAAVRDRGGFHSADILEEPFACSVCGMGGSSGGCWLFHPGLASAQGLEGDRAQLAACSLDSMAAATAVDERVAPADHGQRPTGTQ